MKVYFLAQGLMLLFFCTMAGGQTNRAGDYYASLTHTTFRNGKAFHDTIDMAAPDLLRMQAVLFFLTNEIRARQKLPLVTYASKLSSTAQMHARDMVEQHYFSHINSRDKTKKTPNDRAKTNGISNPFLAENIIEGYGLQYKTKSTVYLRGKGKFSYSPAGEILKAHTYLSLGEDLMDRWMHSKDHRRNILATEAIQLGCGIFFYNDPDFNFMPTCIAVQNFQWHQPVR